MGPLSYNTAACSVREYQTLFSMRKTFYSGPSLAGMTRGTGS